MSEMNEKMNADMHALRADIDEVIKKHGLSDGKVLSVAIKLAADSASDAGLLVSQAFDFTKGLPAAFVLRGSKESDGCVLNLIEALDKSNSKRAKTTNPDPHGLYAGEVGL